MSDSITRQDSAAMSPASTGSHAGVRCIAFDCFGTLFDMSSVPHEEIAAYAHHVRQSKFVPYAFPEHWYTLPAHQDVVEGIRRLRFCDRNYYCIALSNGSRDLIETLADRAGFAFDRAIDLREWGVYKPHRDAYMTVFAETRFRTHETLMVTSNPTFGDIEGASAIGMQTQVIRHGYPNTVIELAEMLGA